MHRGWSHLALTCLCLGMLCSSPAPATDDRTGWHGETMPDGLVRAETEGEYVWEKDGAVMVYVPPGAFPMGSDDGSRDERPVHRVWLDGFYIDKHEVSWEQWKTSGLGYETDPHSRLLKPRAPDWGVLDDHPVVNVSWKDVREYADWAGKQLPTEAQWEKAARGTDGRKFPWGSTPPTPSKAVWQGHPIAEESTAPVTCCADGASPYGALNMAGNVYEWVLDIYDPGFYAKSPTRNPARTGAGRHRVLRGGAFPLSVDDLRSAYRYRLLEDDRGPYIGFRTVVPGTVNPPSAKSPESSPPNVPKSTASPGNGPPLPGSRAAE